MESNMKKIRLAVLVVPFLLLLYGCGTGTTTEPDAGPEPSETSAAPEQSANTENTEQAADEQEQVKQLVEAFGKKLQFVSLLAPEDVVQKSIAEHYGGIVSDELLKQWQENPADAPGRTVSSPWPDRIEIAGMTKTADDTYEVTGHIIEVTSAEPGGNAAKIPIALTAQKSGDRWRITDVQAGDEKGTDATTYIDKQYGFGFALPNSWEGYTVVKEQWEGRALTGNRQGDVTESGPLLLIRHPQWTPQKVRQDIPLMIFTHAQWEALQQGQWQVGAAPVPPTELGRNDRYVFALPARYNYAFPDGWEEVEQILQSNPLEVINGL